MRVPENRVCPCCTAIKEDVPGMFNASKCRLRLYHSVCASRVVLTCHTCLTKGRIGQVRALDVIPPEIYVCGIGALSTEIQRYVNDLIRYVELEADVVCYSETDEDPVLFEKSLFLLVLVSVAYLNSDQFILDLRRARHLGKRIISVLVPNSPGPDSFWLMNWNDVCEHLIANTHNADCTEQVIIGNANILLQYSNVLVSETLMIQRIPSDDISLNLELGKAVVLDIATNLD